MSPPHDCKAFLVAANGFMDIAGSILVGYTKNFSPSPRITALIFNKVRLSIAKGLIFIFVQKRQGSVPLKLIHVYRETAGPKKL